MKKSKFKLVLSRFHPEEDAYQNQLSIVSEAEFEGEARAFRLDCPKSRLLLITDPTHVFADIRLAADLRASLLVDGKIRSPRRASGAYYSLRLRYADSREALKQAFGDYSDHLLDRMPSTIGYEKARSKLCHALSRVSPALSVEVKDVFLSRFENAWSQKKRNVTLLISVDRRNPSIESVITDPVIFSGNVEPSSKGLRYRCTYGVGENEQDRAASFRGVERAQRFAGSGRPEAVSSLPLPMQSRTLSELVECP